VIGSIIPVTSEERYQAERTVNGDLTPTFARLVNVHNMGGFKNRVRFTGFAEDVPSISVDDARWLAMALLECADYIELRAKR
jgi:hypothetical protein